MEMPAQVDFAVKGAPARRVDSSGRVYVDQRAVLGMALPLMAGCGVQILLTLTDVWFVGHISTRALAAVGVVQGPILVAVCILGSVAFAAQTFVAQYHGARRYRRASQSAWSALWAILCSVPLFLLVGSAGRLLVAPFGLDPDIAQLTSQFWLPRISGAWMGVAASTMMGFFNGIGQPRTTLLMSATTLAANVLFNQLFIVGLSWGVAGSAWATNIAQASGLLVALRVFMGRTEYATCLTWKPHRARLLEQLRLGLPMGLLTAGDLLGFSLFQIMQVRVGVAEGAATQVVIALTAASYTLGFGIASAGAILVGQSIGAGDTCWALRIGSRVILLTALYMGSVGVLLALAGPWIVPLLTNQQDSASAATNALGVRLLWIAAAYQLFDGLNLGGASCLRGAGDAVIPAALVMPLSLLVFVPMAHSLTFRRDQGWVEFLPQFGWGATGGWTAVLIYMILLGTSLVVRWRSRAWERLRL